MPHRIITVGMGKGVDMLGFSMTGFVAHVSRGDDRAYAIVSVDPCLMCFDDESGLCQDTLEALEPVFGDSALAIAQSGSAVIVLPDLQHAGDLMIRIEKAMIGLPDIGLVVSMLVRGHAMLDLRQEGATDPELPLAPQPELM